MGPLLSHVTNLGSGLGRGVQRVWSAPGEIANRGLNFLEDRTYQHLSRNDPARAEALAQSIYDTKNVRGWQEAPAVLTRDSVTAAKQDSSSILNAIYDNELARLNDRAASQAAIAPGALRFAGQMAPHVAVGVGAVKAWDMYQDRAVDQANAEQFEKLRQMGLSEKDLEIVAASMSPGQPMTVVNEYV